MNKKEKSCLITNTLIDAINWCLNASDTIVSPERGGDGVVTWREKAWSDLCNMLERKKTPMSPEAQNGINFENRLYDFATRRKLDGSELFQSILKEITGYNFQRKIYNYTRINNQECCIYAKMDASKGNHIIDIKTTGNYKQNNYLNKFQHKLYCYAAGVTEFDYIIVEWEEYPKIKAVHKERYVVEDQQVLRLDVEKTISETIDFLQELKLWDVYREKFCLY